MYLFTLGGASKITDILSNKSYWLSLGVANGLIMIAFLLMYRVDAQNIALRENDLEDTEWLTVKRLRKLREFTVTNFDSMSEHEDGIVIGAEKKGRQVEIITTSQLHALIVGTTGSGKTTALWIKTLRCSEEVKVSRASWCPIRRKNCSKSTPTL